MPKELTTIQLSTEARDRLREIASFHKRSMAGQLEWMIEQEYQELTSSVSGKPETDIREWGAVAKNNNIPKGQIELPVKE